MLACQFQELSRPGSLSLSLAGYRQERPRQLCTSCRRGHLITAILSLSHSESEQEVDMAFLGTRAGLLRVTLFVGLEQVSNR